MLATVSLMDTKDLAVFRSLEVGTGNMDVTTECISLSTASFDEMPPEAQKAIKKTMELQLRNFGHIYLAALHLGLAIGNAGGICRAFEDSMELFRRRVREMMG